MYNRTFTLEGRIVDVVNGQIIEGSVTVRRDRITEISAHKTDRQQYIVPGLVDAHVHIESSMLVPAEFARLAVVHGTIATVSDPHEIANVLGIEGIEFMIRNGGKVPFHFHFGAPSCVPATPFETAGAMLDAESVEKLLQRDDIGYLSEMMNFPGVLNNDPEVMAKIRAAQKYNKPVDGHAPGLKGDKARQYAAAGIHTDHECFTLEEAQDKIDAGMMIAIREGSAAKNFEALYPLLQKHPDKVMFCSDDKHPDDLIQGHIDQLIRRSIAKGTAPMDAIRAATLNPVRFYNLPVGLLREGDPASFIVVDNLEQFNVQQTYIQGELLAENGRSSIRNLPEKTINNFTCDPIREADIEVFYRKAFANAIVVEDGQIMTGGEMVKAANDDSMITNDPEHDLLKVVVVNRYKKAKPAVGLIKNMGLKSGAIASSVAHDSHNIIATGSSDAYIVEAINQVISNKGGISVASNAGNAMLPLPVAGLMSTDDGYEIARRYEQLDQLAKKAGSQLSAPFMTLSFMALLVIPKLKISDKGLFDVETFAFTPLFAAE